MKVTRTLRAHCKHQPGQQKLFNLTGPDPDAKAVAESAKEWASQREKNAFATPWSTHNQHRLMRGHDPTDLMIRDQALQEHVRSGGQPAHRSGLGRMWGRMTSPGGARRATSAGRGQMLSNMAQQYQQMGLDPEAAMIRANRALGEGSLHDDLADQVYQHGSMMQHMFTPSGTLMDARARSRVRGGEGGGGIQTGLRGLWHDYVGGQQREQDIAAQDAQQLWQQQQQQQRQHMGRSVQRQHGNIQDMEAARDRRSLQFQGDQSAMDPLQQQRLTGDWRQQGLFSRMHSGRGDQSVYDADLQRAQHGSWWDAPLAVQAAGGVLGGIPGYAASMLFSSRARNLAGGAWDRLMGRERTGHGEMMRTNDAYRQAVQNLQQGGYREGMDLTGLIAGSRGREAGWYDPRGWFGSGTVGRREGVDFQKTLGGNRNFQEMVTRMQTGQMSEEQAQREMQNLSSIPEEQRAALGIDRAFEKSLDPRTRGLASSWMQASDTMRDMSPEDRAGMFAERSKPRPETRSTLEPSPAQDRQSSVGTSGEHGKGSRGETVKLSSKTAAAGHNWAQQAMRTPSPYNPHAQNTPHNMTPTGTPFDQSDSARRLTGLRQMQAGFQRWDPSMSGARMGGDQNRPYERWQDMGQREGHNIYRQHEYNPYDDRSQMRGVGQRIWGGLSRPFMTDAAIRRRDPGAQQAAQQIASGGWQPGMPIEYAATGTGGHFAPFARASQWLGLSQSPEQHAAQLRQHALKSKGMEQLEQQYAQGRLSPQQFQQAVGGNIGQMYASDPQRFAQLAGQARGKRDELTWDSIRSQAAQHRRRAEGPQAEAMYAI